MPQPLRHVVERMHEETHLVVRRQGQLRVEVALCHCARALHEILDRLHEPLCREDRPVPRREQRQQQHDGQRQDETRLERPPQVVLLAELLVGRLHRIRQRAESLRDRVHALQQQPFAAQRGRFTDRHGRADQVAAVLLRLEAHEGLSLPQLQQHLARDVLRHDVRRQALAHRDDTARLRRYRQFDRADLPSHRFEQPGHRRARDADFLGDAFGSRQVLAHAHFQRRARQHQCVVEALADLDVEPAVDALVQELHREEVHEQDRQRREHAENPDHARLEPRADDVPAPVPDQLRELHAEQPDQHHEAGDVDPQDPRMQPAELLRVLRGLGHEQDGRKPQQAAETHGHRRGGTFQGRSVHVFQSLSALQSSVQNSSQPKTSGAVFIPRTARMRPS